MRHGMSILSVTSALQRCTEFAAGFSSAHITTREVPVITKTVCDCGTRLTEKQIARGGQYCSSSCDGKYRKRGPVRRGFGLEVPINKRPSLGAGAWEYFNGAVRPAPREGK